jgi:hypothetical protein
MLKVTNISDRLDHIASELESENPALALALDRISDRLDRFATDIPVTPDQQKALKDDIWPLFKQIFELRDPSSFGETRVEKMGDKISVAFKVDAYMDTKDLRSLLQSAPNGLGLNVGEISVAYTPEEFKSITGLKEVK